MFGGSLSGIHLLDWTVVARRQLGSVGSVSTVLRVVEVALSLSTVSLPRAGSTFRATSASAPVLPVPIVRAIPSEISLCFLTNLYCELLKFP